MLTLESGKREGRRQREEGRGKKAEGRRQKAEGRFWILDLDLDF